MNTETKLAEISNTCASTGWALIKETLEKELLRVALALCDRPTMTKDEIDYMRGTMNAMRRMIDMPEMMKTSLETDLAIERSATSGRPAPR